MYRKAMKFLCLVMVACIMVSTFGFLPVVTKVQAATEYINDNFETSSVGAAPGGYSPGSNSTVTFAVYQAPDNSGKVLELDQFATSASTYSFRKNISVPGLRKAVLTYRIRTGQTSAAIYLPRLMTGSGAELAKVCFNSDGNFSVWDTAAKKWAPVTAYSADTWYDIKMVADIDTKKYDVYINGNAVLTQKDILAALDTDPTKPSLVTGMGFGIYRANIGKIYVDDIKLSSYIPAIDAAFSQSEYNIPLGASEQLKLNFSPVDASDQSAVWSSDNTSVADVDSNGVVTAKAVGTATIKAVPVQASLHELSVVCNVYEQRAQSITLNKTALSLPTGGRDLLNATVLPENCTDKSITWSSDDSAVATVDSFGEITAIAEGTALITATSKINPAAKASATITVGPKQIQKEFYVSPKGNDGNPGTEALPFKTIQKAQEEVRKINDNMIGDIVVYLRAGTYYVDSTIVMNESDSGTNGFYITYKSYPGEKAEISGGKEFTGWTLADAGKNIYSVHVGTGIQTRQVFINGVRATRARSNTGLTNAVKTAKGYTADDSFLAQYKKPSDLEFVYIKDWTNPRCGVEGVALNSGKIDIKMDEPGWGAVIAKGGTSVNLPLYYENAMELLDEEGEWYLNTDEGNLYYKPRGWENMSNVVATLPVLEKMMTVKGSSVDAIVKNIQFDGIKFEYTTWLFPSTGYGLSDAQNNHLRYWNLGLQDYLPDGAIELELSNSINFENCEFTKLGITGIKMVNGVQNTLIKGNKFYDISGSAINIGEPDHANVDAYNPADPRKIVKNDDVINNYIHDIGVDYMSAAAISAAYPEDVDILQNEICNVPYSGLHIGYGFKAIFPNTLKNMKVLNNYIHDFLGKGLKDGGGVYLNGNSGGTEDNLNLVKGNYIRNEMAINAPLYPDEGTSFWKMDTNVIDQRESPLWDGNPSRWAMVYVPSINHVYFDNNYTTTSTMVNKGVNNVEFANTHVYTDANWPQEAQEVIANSGLTAAYKGLTAGYVERLKAADLTVNVGEAKKIVIAAEDGKENITNTDGFSTYYKVEDTSIASVDAAGNVTGLKKGKTKVMISMIADTVLKTAETTVYVGDTISSIGITDNPGSDIYMMKGSTKQLSVFGLSELGLTYDLTNSQYTSSNPDIVSVDESGNLTAINSGKCTLNINSKFNGSDIQAQYNVIVSDFGDSTEYAVRGIFNDLDKWYINGAGGSKIAGDKSITISAPNGFSIYQGRQFFNELLTFNMTINGAATGWPSLMLRNQRTDVGMNDTTYVICFWGDHFELQRFNSGKRTVIYGNVTNYTSTAGGPIPNTVFSYNEPHIVQVGTVNEADGVRIILNIDGQGVINYLDPLPGAIANPGYIGLYAKTNSITLSELSYPDVYINGADKLITGDELTANIGLASVSQTVYNKISSADITFNYDSNLFDFVNAEALKQDTAITNTDTAQSGTVKLSVASANGQEVDADGDLVRIILKAKAINPSTELKVSSFSMTDSSGKTAGLLPYYKTVAVTQGEIILPADKASLKNVIEAAQILHSSAVEGTSAGQYPAGSKVILDSAISVAQAVYDNVSALQAEVNTAEVTLTQAITEFKSTIIKGHSSGGNHGTDPVNNGSTGGTAGGSDSQSTSVPTTDNGIIKIPEIKVDGSGLAAINIDSSILKAAFDKAVSDSSGAKLIQIDSTQANGAGKYSAALPADILYSQTGKYDIRLTTSLGLMDIPSSIFGNIDLKNIKEVKLIIENSSNTVLNENAKSVIGTRPIMEFSIEVDGRKVETGNTARSIKTQIPYNPSEKEATNPEHLVIMSINESGSATPVSNGRYDKQTKSVVFNTSDTGKYAVAYVVKDFEDTRSYTWASREISVLASKGIIDGTSPKTFSPESNITRGDFIKLLISTLNLKAAKPDYGFVDIDKSDYYAEAVAIAKALGIASGEGNNSFNPDSEISRQDMFVVTARALKAAGKLNSSLSQDLLSSIKDYSDIAGYALEDMSVLYKENLIKGSDNRMNPQDQATRAEAAVILYRLYNK